MKNLMCLLFLLLFCFSINLEANSPIIIPNFPQSGQENIAINSKISFHTNYEIDTSSLIHLSPIQNFYVNDTVFVEKKYAQIMLIRKEYYQNIPDSLHYIYATEGSITTNSDNITINFNIHSLLDYETEYTLVVKDLFVIKPDTTQPSGYDTLAIDTTIVDFFKTTEVPIQLVSTSIDDREYQVLAGENLELLFSKKFLSSDLTNHNIATLAKVIDTVYVDSVNYYYVLDTVSTQRTLALDSTKIILNPDSLLELGKSYILSVDLKNIYGEYQPFYKEFWVKNYAKITLVTRAYYYDPDTNVVTDLFGSVFFEPDFDNAPLRDTVDNSFMGIVESQDVIYYPGTEFLARVPVTTPNDFYFVGFECPEDSSLNANYEDNTISVALTDTNLMDRTIIAKYNLAEDLQIELPFNVNIRGYDNLVCTKDSTIVYSFKNMPNNEVTIYPQCTTGIPLLNWTSNDPEYDGSAVPCISVPSSPKIDFGPFHYPHKRDFIPNWDNMYTPCTGSRYKVELRYASNFVSDYETKQYEIPLSGINTNDIISTFQVITTLDPLVYETVNINTLESSIYCGISQEYTDPTHNQKIIKFEINSQYKDIYEILYVQCYSNGILDGSKPNGSDIYLSNGENPIGDSWEHNIENKNLKLYLGQFGGSSNCLETIYVYICRKMQNLTIEKEMLELKPLPYNLINTDILKSVGNDPANYLEYKNPEKTITSGKTTNIKNFYAIPSGDTVRIKPSIKEKTGFHLDSWDCEDGNICSPIESPFILSIVMNQDKKAKLLSKEGFRLDAVWYDGRLLGNPAQYPLYANPKNEGLRLYDPYIGDMDQKEAQVFTQAYVEFDNGGFDLQYPNLSNTSYIPNQYHKNACRITLEFNKPVDKESLENGLLIYDNDKRLDGLSMQTYLIKFSDGSGIYGVDYNAIRYGNRVEILLVNINQEKKWAPHKQQIKFEFADINGNTVIKPEDFDQENPEYLENAEDNTLVRVTGLPGIKLTTYGFYNGICDTYNGDIEAYIWGVVSVKKDGENIDINQLSYEKDDEGRTIYGGGNFRFPLTETHSMSEDSWWGDGEAIKEILLLPQLKTTNNIVLFFQLLDENSFGISLEDLVPIATTAVKQILTGGGDLVPTLKEIASLIIKATSGGGFLKEDDKSAGYGGFVLRATERTRTGTYGAKDYVVEPSIWGQDKLYEPLILVSSFNKRHDDCNHWIDIKFQVWLLVELGCFGY